MVEYLKTKKGYFYKLLKNGERKRISQEEYNRKNKKMIGGVGKTKQEIIDKLMKGVEYDSWLRSGSEFGKIHKNSRGKYEYTDIKGKPVYVNEVVNNYEVEPDTEYIPVFGPYNFKNESLHKIRIKFKEQKEERLKQIDKKGKKRILNELNKENRYSEWYKEGRLYGKIFRGSNGKYAYTDIKGNLVFVNRVTTNYVEDPNIKQIPVFGPYDPHKKYLLKQKLENKKKKIEIQMEKKVKIIDELRDQGKYEKWVEKGSRFGVIRKGWRTPYMYIGVNDKPVKVSYITSNYSTYPDIEQFAVFDPYGPTYNNPYVDQNKYSIVSKDITLITSGLGTCTALAMIIGNKKFMVHLDAKTNYLAIIDVIKKIIEEENVSPIILKPYIYAGGLNSSYTLNMSKEICKELDISKENYNISNVSTFEYVFF